MTNYSERIKTVAGVREICKKNNNKRKRTFSKLD
jgi:hypothetical protein